MADGEEKLAIDINCDKFIDWLTSRNLTTLQWSKEVGQLRERIDKARAELPLGVKSTIEGTDLNYFDCERIMRLLEEEEKQSGGKVKNLFGSYTSDVLKLWGDILSSYKKNSLFLAEAGRLMTQAVNFDIPNLKGSISSSSKQLADTARKILDSRRNAKDQQQSYDGQCTALFLPHNCSAERLKRELKRTSAQLTKMLRRVQRDMHRDSNPGVWEAIEYYKSFVSYHAAGGAGGDMGDAQAATLLPTLLQLMTSEALPAEEEEEEQKEQKGDGDDGAGDAEIDWDLSVEDAGAGAEPVEIDWSAALSLEDSGAVAAAGTAGDEASAAAGGTDAAVEIDWGISLEDGGASGEAPAASRETTGQTQLETPSASACPLLDAECRRSVMTDLQELEAFLEQRRVEMSAAGTTNAVSSLQHNASANLTQTIDSVESMLAPVRALIGSLQTPSVSRLLMIHSSDSYVDRLVTSLQIVKATAERLERTAVTLEGRQTELSHSIDRNKRKLQHVTEATKTLQQQTQKALSQMFDGRDVNIFGAINQI